MTAKEVLKLLKQNGWYICETKGSHYQLKHLKIKRKNNYSLPWRRFKGWNIE